MSSTLDLRALVDALGGARWDEALGHALSAWRATRAPELGELIDVIDLRVRAAPVPPRSTAESFEEAWLERAKQIDDATTGALVASLGRRAVRTTTFPDGAAWPGFEARIAELSRRPHDPRIAQALVRLVTTPPPWCDSPAAYARIFDARVRTLLVANADRRVIASLRRAFSREEGYTSGSLLDAVAMVSHGLVPRIARAGGASEAALDPDTASELAAWTERVRPGRLEGGLTGALLDAVYADVDDDDARSVLADTLLERNDPRGEFMALSLQLARSPKMSSANRGRMGKLLREHEIEWLGEHLVRLLDRRIWHRGMIDRAVLVPRRLAAGAWEAWEAFDDDRCATLRVLDQGAATTADFVGFIAGRGLRGLRTITEQSKADPTRAFFDALAGVKLPNITALRMTSFSKLAELERLGAVGETALPSLTQLELLAIPVEGVLPLANALLTLPSLAGLAAVHVEARQYHTRNLEAGGFIRAMANGARFRHFGLTTHEATITVERGADGLTIELASKTGDGFVLLRNVANVDRLVVTSTHRLVDAPGLHRILKDLRPREVVLPAGWSPRPEKRRT